MDMSLSKLQEMVKDREVLRAAVHRVATVGQDWATKKQQLNQNGQDLINKWQHL